VKESLGVVLTASSQYEVWCDKPSDKDLVRAFSRVSAFWSRISSVQIIPNMSREKLVANPRLAAIAPLLDYDRPDMIIMLGGRPVLVIEITEHGYTGDNPLQRFARLARAAEMGIPSIHFTPFARTRYDEMLYTDNPTSARKVSSRLFEGFLRLTRVYGVPVVAMDWAVSRQGLPIRPSNDNEIRQIYGEVIDYAEHLCEHDGEHVLHGESILNCQVIARAIEATKKKAAQSNVLESEIRIENVPYPRVCQLVSEPKSIVDLIGSDYFMKGKDHKLVALRAIEDSVVESVETPGGLLDVSSARADVGRLLPAQFGEKAWLVFYSGYEWRSQPNGGIVVNTEILYCRSEFGKTVRDRNQYLVVVWPRVFWNRSHPRRIALLRELEAFVDSSQTTRLGQLIVQKRIARGIPLDHPNYVAYNADSIGTWAEGGEAGRIYRNYCDLIILNDRVLLGNHWKM